MKKELRKHLLILLSVAAVLTLAGTWAGFTDQVSVINKLMTGDVDITLREYELAEGKEIPYQNQKQVQPGDIISKIPRITNEAEPCWVRVRVQYRNEPSGFVTDSDGTGTGETDHIVQSGISSVEGLTSENLYGLSSKWLQKGDYYYYREILDKKASVDLFHHVRIPEGWDQGHHGQKLAVIIQAEAIQAANFEPDFDAMSPWGNEEIELCVHESGDRMEIRKEQLVHKIEFNGTAHKLIAVSSDFFSNFRTAMPGDQLTDAADLSNTTGHKAKLYFSTSSINGEDRELLASLGLEIRYQDLVIYQGNLLSEALNQEILLTELETGQHGKLEFTVTVPSGLKNAYALRQTAVKWNFRVEEQEAESVTVTPSPIVTPITTPTPALDQPGQGTTILNSTTSTPYGNTQLAESVKTGDDSQTGYYIWLAMAGLVVAGIIIHLFRERSRRN